MKYLPLLLIFITSTANAFLRNRRPPPPPRPYKILILADEAARGSADLYRTYLLNQRPFNQIRPEDLVVEVQTVPAADMGCTNPGTTNNRIINCDDNKLRRFRRDANASIAVAFTSTATGGAGGEIPVATSDFSAYPISTMFHEMLHAYGFADEYQYVNDQERNDFCNPPRALPNVAYFDDTPPYANDGTARSTHAGDVPWMGSITADTLITHGTDLGTTTLPHTERGEQTLGLFAGGPCSKWMKSWRPYQGSIMREYQDDTIYPIYERVILERIEDAIGRVPQFKPPQLEVLQDLANETPIVLTDCPPEGTEEINETGKFLNQGMRIVEGMDDKKVREGVRKLQKEYLKGRAERSLRRPATQPQQQPVPKPQPVIEPDSGAAPTPESLNGIY